MLICCFGDSAAAAGFHLNGGSSTSIMMVGTGYHRYHHPDITYSTYSTWTMDHHLPPTSSLNSTSSAMLHCHFPAYLIRSRAMARAQCLAGLRVCVLLHRSDIVQELT
jgi:hypothetical protein